MIVAREVIMLVVKNKHHQIYIVAIILYLFLKKVYDVFFFFFFQAEDGIRDADVTGVQTCALPISSTNQPRSPPCSRVVTSRDRLAASDAKSSPYCSRLNTSIAACSLSTRICRACTRSEERRVGKECRSRWSAYQCEKNKKMYGVDM